MVKRDKTGRYIDFFWPANERGKFIHIQDTPFMGYRWITEDGTSLTNLLPYKNIIDKLSLPLRTRRILADGFESL